MPWEWFQEYLLEQKYIDLRWNNIKSYQQWELRWKRLFKNNDFRDWGETLRRKGGHKIKILITINGKMIIESS